MRRTDRTLPTGITITSLVPERTYLVANSIRAGDAEDRREASLLRPYFYESRFYLAHIWRPVSSPRSFRAKKGTRGWT
jgi:hypothetical protein